jgi:hypothetical protein
MSEHNTSTRESEERAAIADALRLKSAQRSWRAIEAAGRDADFAIVQLGGKTRADRCHGPDYEHLREEADEVCMQCAAGIGVDSAVAVVMAAAVIAVGPMMMSHVVVMVLRNSLGGGLRVRAR